MLQLQVEKKLKPFALARPHSLCVVAGNILHILDTSSHGDQLDGVGEMGCTRTPMAFEFSKSATVLTNTCTQFMWHFSFKWPLQCFPQYTLNRAGPFV